MERRYAPGLIRPPGFSHVVTATGSRIVTTAGAVPLGPDGRLVGPGDPVAQTEQTLRNPMAALATAGAAGEDVLKTTVHVVAAEPADLTTVWRVVQRTPFAAAASTLLGVALLGYEGQLVEIEAIAVLP